MQRNESVSAFGATTANAHHAVRVAIYITRYCRICEYAHEVAEAIRQEFPEVDLDVIDIAASQQPIPDIVFATPTYLLNGKVWSLGNPSLEEMRQRLSQELDTTTIR
ncbi:MAG: thioredoxin family protein [Caldilineaceae bacterium]|nr:thioredoxin family protein [Caldilineaceae bacterium]